MGAIVNANLPEAYRLLHYGSIALARAEERGIPVDMEYCQTQHNRLTRKIKYLNNKMADDPIIKRWRTRYGAKYNEDSNTQLGAVLFGDFKHTTEFKTASGQNATSEASLKSTGLPLVDNIIEIRKLKKIRDTYLRGFMREQVDGILHPTFNLSLVDTYRSSAQDPNIQNIPNRVQFIKKLCRQALLAEEGYLIVFLDYSGVEVRVATCYHQDPNMIAEIEDDKRDMHRDMACQSFMLTPDECSKAARQSAKSGFVFSQFYGDYYVNNANNLWEAISTVGITTTDGMPMKQHLKSKGIGTLKKFTDHMKEVERFFWEEKFGVYGKWRKDMVKQYTKKGYVDSLTGFRYTGFMDHKQVTNYPIQGSAFHCLLKSAINIDHERIKRGWKSGTVGQIHDEVIMAVHPNEYDEVIDVCIDIMTRKLKEQWPWIIVPLDVEPEVVPVGGNWYQKEEAHPIGCPGTCGTKWVYKKKIQHADGYIATCPVCGAEKEYA